MVKPETVFKVGAVRAAVFRNTIEKNGQLIPTDTRIFSPLLLPPGYRERGYLVLE